MRTYDTIRALRDGETIEIEGVEVEMDGDGRPTKKGDWYVAERNTGPKLLTVHDFAFDNIAGEVERRDEIGPHDWPSWIHPHEIAYAFDYAECVLVKVIDLEA